MTINREQQHRQHRQHRPQQIERERDEEREAERARRARGSKKVATKTIQTEMITPGDYAPAQGRCNKQATPDTPEYNQINGLAKQKQPMRVKHTGAHKNYTNNNNSSSDSGGSSSTNTHTHKTHDAEYKSRQRYGRVEK